MLLSLLVLITGGLANLSAQKDSKEVLALFTEAATSRANGEFSKALETIDKIKELEPEHPRAHFAYAQLLQEQHHWKSASESYEQSAKLEKDPQQKGQCWFGVGISQYMQVILVVPILQWNCTLV